jgi:hypothetical protein
MGKLMGAGQGVLRADMASAGWSCQLCAQSIVLKFFPDNASNIDCFQLIQSSLCLLGSFMFVPSWLKE